MTPQESEAVKRAKEEMDAHNLTVISKDNQPDRDTLNFGKLPFCKCPDCRPDLYPSNIQDLLDEDIQQVAWFYGIEHSSLS